MTDSKATLTIEKPTLTTYGGTGSASATLTGLSDFNAATGKTIAETDIQYFKATKSGSTYTKSGSALTAAPTDAGDYLAEITLTGVKTSAGDNQSVTASVGYTIAPDSYTVTLSGGANATTSGGATTQTVSADKAMTTVTYTANDGFSFRTVDQSTNGITMKCTDGKTLTVSGTPTANVEITVPDAEAVIIPYSVTLTGGANATTSGGATTQTNLTGAMEKVTYTANSGYHFAEFTAITSNDVTATWSDDKTVTVSGTPTADVTIEVPDAVLISYTVTLSGGANANVNGSTTQTVTGNGAMTTVTYTAKSGYHFAKFDDITNNGVTATWTSDTVVTVSGTPTGNVTITVPSAAEIKYTVNLTGGANANVNGSTTQTVAQGKAMVTVTYTAKSGYYFAEFAGITNNGVTAKRTNSTTVTVSGTPTADAAITVPGAVAHTHSFTYTASGATITAKCATPACDITTGLTLTLSAPQNLTYDDKPKEATLNTDYNKTAFPGTYAIEYWQGSTKLTSAPVNVGKYQARVAVEGATATLDFSIAGQTPEITYSRTTKVNNNFIKKTIQTTGQYLLLENNPNDISYMEDGKIYVVRGDVTIGALVYTGNVTLVLCKGAKLTVRAGIYHIGSELELYTEDGGEDAVVNVTGTATQPALSGNIAIYGGNVTASAAEGGKLFADDTVLTIGAGVKVDGLTSGTEQEDGSTTYTADELESVKDTFTTRDTQKASDGPTSDKSGGGCDTFSGGLLALAALALLRSRRR